MNTTEVAVAYFKSSLQLIITHLGLVHLGDCVLQMQPRQLLRGDLRPIRLVELQQAWQGWTSCIIAWPCWMRADAGQSDRTKQVWADGPPTSTSLSMATRPCGKTHCNGVGLDYCELEGQTSPTTCPLLLSKHDS